MGHENLSLILTMASGFAGCMAGCLCAGFWLATRFNNVYSRMEDHEKSDIQRFADLKLMILDRTFQAQIVEGWKTTRPK